MHDTIQFVASHGYTLLFVWVLAEQIGLPIPAFPILLAAGALAGSHNLNLGLAFVLAACASVISDTLWYQLGRRRGASILGFLCKISLEPDSCVRRTEDTFQRYGARSLLVAKFLPGLNTAAPPMAGITGMPRKRFLAWSSLGALLWSGAFILVGYFFSNQLERIGDFAEGLGNGFLVLLVLAFGIYLLRRYQQRRSFLQQLVRERIQPEELRSMLDRREPVYVLDLRHALDFLAYPQLIPGAIRVDPKELDERAAEIPRDREIILYCT
ncbi:MAG TPA: VTT domain-containing protein [Terriglobales bacterium]|nr:VTT domain-containing protein [Terriglobales bacterium]